MAVSREGVIARFVGLSTDTKPNPNVDSTLAAIPPGSFFTELDTAAIWRWDGSNWLATSAGAAAQVALVQLAVMAAEQLELVRDLRLETVAQRLAFQEYMNEGNAIQHDFRDLALSILDRAETEEP